MAQKEKDLLGVDLGEETFDEIPEGMPDEIVEMNPDEPTGEVISSDDVIYIENYDQIAERVKREIEEKKLNPSVVQEDDAGTVHINGEPMVVIDDKYVPFEEAQIVLQTRKVVREYLKLQDLINKEKK